jgi:hypothetical protein
MKKMTQKIVLFLSLFTIIGMADAQQKLNKKWFPGHYVQIRHYTNPVSENIRDLVKDNPYISGYKVHIVWNEIETAKDQYNFDLLRKFIKLAEGDNKKLMIHIQDRLFGQLGNPYLPEYMLAEEYEGGWYNSPKNGASYGKIWLSSYHDRWNKFLKALANEIDKSQTVAAVIVSESYMDVKTPGYCSEGHLGFIKSMHSTMAEYMPNTIFFQYVNWGFTEEEREIIMTHVVEVCKNGFGGPDLMNSKKWPKMPNQTMPCTSNDFGHFYTRYKGMVPLSVENQPSGYYKNSAQAIFNFAVDTVGVNFLPWTAYMATDRGWNFYDAIKVINEQKGRINTTPPASLLVH